LGFIFHCYARALAGLRLFIGGEGLPLSAREDEGLGLGQRLSSLEALEEVGDVHAHDVAHGWGYPAVDAIGDAHGIPLAWDEVKAHVAIAAEIVGIGEQAASREVAVHVGLPIRHWRLLEGLRPFFYFVR
jgi:hypothetical protein